MYKRQQKNYWGGSADGKTLDNYYINFRSGDTDWMVLNLEFGPSDKALQWADSIVGIRPDNLVILNTHAYLYCLLYTSWDWSPYNGWAMNHQIKGHNECHIIYILGASSPTYPIAESVRCV